MVDEWWGDSPNEASTSLVNRMAESISGNQWDTFNGGRLRSQTSAPSKLGQLHEMLNFFAPLLLRHLIAKKAYFPKAERIKSRGDQCMDYLLESHQLGTEDETRGDWIRADVRYQGTKHPDYFTCRFQGDLIFKAKDGTAYCSNCWALFDEDYPAKQSLSDRLRARRKLNTAKDVSTLQVLLEQVLEELQKINNSTMVVGGIKTDKTSKSLTMIKEKGVTDLENKFGQISLPVDLKTFVEFEEDLLLRTGLVEGVFDPNHFSADTTPLFTVIIRLSDTATRLEISAFQKWYGDKVGPAGTAMGLFALLRMIKFCSKTEVLKEHLDGYFASLRNRQDKNQSLQDYLHTQDNLNLDLVRIRLNQPLDEMTMTYLFLLKMQPKCREEVLKEYRRVYPDVSISMQNVRAILTQLSDLTADKVAVTLNKEELGDMLAAGMLAATNGDGQMHESARQRDRQANSGGFGERERSRGTGPCPFCDGPHMHWLCRAAEGHPAETSKGSRKYEIRNFKYKDTSEGKQLRNEGGPFYQRASTERSNLFWNRDGFDESVHGKRTRLTALWYAAGCPGRNPGTGKAVNLPDDRASGFSIRKHSGNDKVAAVAPSRKNRKTRGKAAKKAKTKSTAASGVQQQLSAIFGDEEEAKDIFGCVVSLDNMGPMDHPVGMSERLTEIFCETPKPLKLLNDGEENEDAIRDYLLNSSARIDDQYMTLLVGRVKDENDLDEFGHTPSDKDFNLSNDTSCWMNGVVGDEQYFGDRKAAEADATHHNPVILDPRGMGPCQNCNTMCSKIERCYNCGNAKQDTDKWRERATRGNWPAPREARTVLEDALRIDGKIHPKATSKNKSDWEQTEEDLVDYVDKYGRVIAKEFLPYDSDRRVHYVPEGHTLGAQMPNECVVRNLCRRENSSGTLEQDVPHRSVRLEQVESKSSVSEHGFRTVRDVESNSHSIQSTTKSPLPCVEADVRGETRVSQSGGGLGASARHVDTKPEKRPRYMTMHNKSLENSRKRKTCATRNEEFSRFKEYREAELEREKQQFLSTSIPKQSEPIEGSSTSTSGSGAGFPLEPKGDDGGSAKLLKGHRRITDRTTGKSRFVPKSKADVSTKKAERLKLENQLKSVVGRGSKLDVSRVSIGKLRELDRAMNFRHTRKPFGMNCSPASVETEIQCPFAGPNSLESDDDESDSEASGRRTNSWWKKSGESDKFKDWRNEHGEWDYPDSDDSGYSINNELVVDRTLKSIYRGLAIDPSGGVINYIDDRIRQEFAKVPPHLVNQRLKPYGKTIEDVALPMVDIVSCSSVQAPNNSRLSRNQRKKIEALVACSEFKGNSGGAHRSITVHFLLDKTINGKTAIEVDETIDTAAGMNYCILDIAKRLILNCSNQIVAKGRYKVPALTYAANETSMARLGWFEIELTVKDCSGEWRQQTRRYEIVEKCVLAMIQGVGEISRSRAHLSIHDQKSSSTMEQEKFIVNFPDRREYPVKRQVNHVEAVASVSALE